jgi:hypothetical protein
VEGGCAAAVDEDCAADAPGWCLPRALSQAAKRQPICGFREVDGCGGEDSLVVAQGGGSHRHVGVVEQQGAPVGTAAQSAAHAASDYEGCHGVVAAEALVRDMTCLGCRACRTHVRHVSDKHTQIPMDLNETRDMSNTGTGCVTLLFIK